MRPLIATSAAAAALFWTVFVLWGVLEWVPILAERRAAAGSDPGEAHDDGSGTFLLVMTYAGFALAFAAAFGLTSTAVGGPRRLLFGIALAVIVAGIAFRQWAVLTLGRLFTRSVTIQREHTVVTSGPYRLVRHPGYLGSLVSCAGLGLALGNWLSIASVLACSLLGHVRRIRVEETALRSRLGDGVYDAYATRRARLVPGIW